MIKQRSRHFIRRHRVLIGVSGVILVAWCTALFLAWNHFETSAQANITAALAESKKSDQLIARLQAKKQAEAQTEKDQQEKEAAEAEAEAKKKAELEAKTATETDQTGGIAPRCNTASAHTNPAAVDVMVNKKHCLQPLAFVPPDLVTTNGAIISAKAASDYNRMFVDAAAAGQPFSVSSSYRSYATQVATYNHWVSVNGRQGADTVSARPGFSEHQTGLAIDVNAGSCVLECFAGTSQYQWFQANAASYGFIQRYYKGYEYITGYASEEWHYRYVGVAQAQDMKAKGIKTLEQYWGLEGGDYR